ncbi:MAG: SsrA-binding protein [Actinomycetota bacterium]|jgi:SsrA-binding protein|nr:SsrA-binding protein [Actinomycetota bacterium]
MPKEQGRKLVASNRKARHDYHIDDVYEAGMVLTGTEVKSLRAGHASLVDGFAHIRDGEAWLANVHIPEYTEGTWTNHEPRRERKLLLHRKEIDRLIGKTQETGVTMVPLALYFKDGKAKVEIALARGKRSYDKRQALAERQATREMQRAMSRRSSGKD